MLSVKYRTCISLVVALFSASAFAQTNDKPASKDDKLPKAKLTVGSAAPDWSLVGSDGKTYKLSAYKGKQAVVVFWYPMALTGG